MKVLKILLFLVIAVVVLLGVVGFFVPAHWTAERAVVIRASPAQVYPWVASFKKWDEWNPFLKEDPSMKLSHSGPEEGVGAVESWESAKMGPGSMTMVKAEPGKEVTYELVIGDGKFSLGGHLALEPVGSDTKVTWRDEGDLGPNPYKHYMSLVLTQAIGTAFEQGLSALKAKVEAAPRPAAPPAPQAAAVIR